MEIVQTKAVQKQKGIGILLVLTAAILWGVSGTVAQYLFHNEGYSSEWLVVIRLLIAGFLLLVISAINKISILDIWTNKKDAVAIVLFGILGMLAVQYTYFAAIEASNAATATLLQYVAPVFIVIYLAVKAKNMPKRVEFIGIFLALIGTFLLVTNGDLNQLSISSAAIIWGLSSALALAFYTLYPIKLLQRYRSSLVMAWGMLIGGVGMSFYHQPWNVEGNFSPQAIIAVIFVIIFGTIIPFFCYLESLKYLSASETSLLACAEPLSAALLAVIWLQVSFGLFEWLGAFCIIATIIVLAKNK